MMLLDVQKYYLVVDLEHPERCNSRGGQAFVWGVTVNRERRSYHGVGVHSWPLHPT